MGWRFIAFAGLLALSGCSWFDQEQQPRETQSADLPSAATAPAPPVITKLSKTAKQDPLPQDVSDFIAKREGCDHFRGEEAYDKERGAFIRDNLDQLCTGTDAALAALKQKYAANAGVTTRLSAFEKTIE